MLSERENMEAEKKKWADELRELMDAVDRAWNSLGNAEAWVWKNVVGNDVFPRQLPQDLEPALTSLKGDLDHTRNLARRLFQRFSADPSGKLSIGQMLSREEYYLIRAMGFDFGGAQEVGLASFSEYEIYRVLCYEDDEWSGYINVHLAPPDPDRVVLRFGRAPEECRRRFLRPEQSKFFRETLPDVYKRFSDN